MLKCFNLNPKYLLQIPKTFLVTKLLRIKTSFFIGSSGRVKLVFHNTAGFFLLKVWKNFEFETLERKSFRSNLSFGHVHAVWRTRKRFFSRISNVFPSQSEQMCKIVTNQKKNVFSYNLACGQIKCSSESLGFFRRMPKIFFLKILK